MYDKGSCCGPFHVCGSDDLTDCMPLFTTTFASLYPRDRVVQHVRYHVSGQCSRSWWDNWRNCSCDSTSISSGLGEIGGSDNIAKVGWSEINMPIFSFANLPHGMKVLFSFQPKWCHKIIYLINLLHKWFIGMIEPIIVGDKVLNFQIADPHFYEPYSYSEGNWKLMAIFPEQYISRNKRLTRIDPWDPPDRFRNWIPIQFK
jgi:hypothetical protein